MGNVITKVDFEHLKAAVVLALSYAPLEDNTPAAIWWDGVVPDADGNFCKIVMVPNDGGYVWKLTQLLEGLGLGPVVPVVGSHTIIPILASKLTNLPGRVTRQWAGLTDDGPHDPWKHEVVAQMDELGIKHITMRFSGSGDNSNDDGWEAPRTLEHWYPRSYNDADQTYWRNQFMTALPDDLTTLISEYVWETLIQHDVVNNDGGGGELEIDVSEDTPVFAFSCYTNEMITHQHECQEEV